MCVTTSQYYTYAISDNSNTNLKHSVVMQFESVARQHGSAVNKDGSFALVDNVEFAGTAHPNEARVTRDLIGWAFKRQVNVHMVVLSLSTQRDLHPQ